MITKLSELKEGSLILCKKEEDNTFSPLLLSEEQGKALKAFLISLSKDEPAISETQFLDEAWQWYNTNMIIQE